LLSAAAAAPPCQRSHVRFPVPHGRDSWQPKRREGSGEEIIDTQWHQRTVKREKKANETHWHYYTYKVERQ
jgi:hypothetical protein